MLTDDPETDAAAAATVTIGSLNLHCGLSGQGQPFDVSAALAGIAADIVTVQEAWWVPGGRDPVGAAAAELGAAVRRTTVCADTTLARLRIAETTERGNWGLAVLTRLPVTGCVTVDLGRALGDVASRRALVCSVRTREGWPLRVVNAHLTHRLTSPAQLYRLARHLSGSDVPTIIAGDLNMPRATTWVAAGYTPTVRGATFPAHRPIIQLDHLLVSPGLECAAATVRPPAGSDHLPVTGRFRRADAVARVTRGRPGRVGTMAAWSSESA